MERVLVSACLLGTPVRYDGKALSIESQLLQHWQKRGRVVSVCPEVGGGMSTPRNPAEIIKGDGTSVWLGSATVKNNIGEEVTNYFKEGALLALKLCQQYKIKVAILTESSPSCGSQMIYDGSFSGNKVKGEGVTAALLKQYGIQVFSQHDIAKAEQVIINAEAESENYEHTKAPV